LQAAIVLGSSNDTETGGELLSWSAAAKGREGWFKRLESGRSALLLHDRNTIFKAASPSRQSRILIPLANDGLLLWESLRRCPEGLTAALVDTQAAREALLRYSAVLDETEKPLIAVTENTLPAAGQCEEWFDCAEFEHILIRAPRLNTGLSALAASAKPLLSKNGSFVLLSSPPHLGERISRILKNLSNSEQLISKLADTEEEFFKNLSGQGIWNEDELASAFEKEGFSIELSIIEQNEERLIGEKDISTWFNIEKSRWGSFISEKLKESEFNAVKQALLTQIANGPLVWRWKTICFKAKSN
ncbi:MAG: recombinase RarA, partial [Treponema sp.]|nr:recombinase RarA [Treponema sp.]